MKYRALIGHRSISLESVYAKITCSQTIVVEHHSAQKLHLSTIALLQIFDLFFTGSRVANIFVTAHTVFIESFYLSIILLPA